MHAGRNKRIQQITTHVHKYDKQQQQTCSTNTTMQRKTPMLLLCTIYCLLGSVSSQTARSVAMDVIALEREFMNAPNDDYSDRDHFDFIVVGAGAAGCVVANRLSESGKFSVLLLEAGPDETASMAIPGMATIQRFASDWNYTTEPMAAGCPLGPTGRCLYPRGKAMGGSTVTNAMMYVRGHPADFDEWERLGNDGWGYNDVLPYFRKSENVQIPQLRSSPYHGTQGPLPISYAPFTSRLTDLVLEAAQEKGIPQVDYNGPSQLGVSRIQTFTWRGERWSANRAFLFGTKRRRNLFVRKHALVTGVLLDATGRRALGVRYERDHASHVAAATREVVLCAGAINSPQLLMLSGIGPRRHLQDLGIPVRKDLPVGQNLVDHTFFLGLPIVFNQSVAPNAFEVFYDPKNYIDYITNRQGPLSNTESVEMIYFFQAGKPVFDSAPNMEMIMLQYPPTVNFANSNVNIYQNLTGKHASVPILVPLQPVSKGNVSLASTDIHDQPKIFPNYFGEEEDVRNALEGLKKMVELFQTQAFQKVGTKLFDEKLPPCDNYEFATDEYLTCVLKRYSLTIYHPCCTNRMGPKKCNSSVVDPDLRVKGIHNLRVVDASVFPTMVSGHLEAPTLMVAEKAADMILKSASKGILKLI